MVGGGRNNAGGEPSAEVLPHRAPALRPREDRGPSCQVEGVEEEKTNETGYPVQPILIVIFPLNYERMLI